MIVSLQVPGRLTATFRPQRNADCRIGFLEGPETTKAAPFGTAFAKGYYLSKSNTCEEKPIQLRKRLNQIAKLSSSISRPDPWP
ncbi:hypothetical protein ACXIUS_15945 [Bosea thiooxidans]|nr:hypothetical protein [Bosea sp. (in: a-proteobacteria)]